MATRRLAGWGCGRCPWPSGSGVRDDTGCHGLFFACCLRSGTGQHSSATPTGVAVAPLHAPVTAQRIVELPQRTATRIRNNGDGYCISSRDSGTVEYGSRSNAAATLLSSLFHLPTTAATAIITLVDSSSSHRSFHFRCTIWAAALHRKWCYWLRREQ